MVLAGETDRWPLTMLTSLPVVPHSVSFPGITFDKHVAKAVTHDKIFGRTNRCVAILGENTWKMMKITHLALFRHFPTWSRIKFFLLRMVLI